jgi:thioredoxin reductase
MNEFDVVVIGGGAAGLSGALTLTRARRSVLVLDAGEPRNAPATGVHGFLTRDGLRPSELVATGAAEVAHYGGTVRHARWRQDPFSAESEARVCEQLAGDPRHGL